MFRATKQRRVESQTANQRTAGEIRNIKPQRNQIKKELEHLLRLLLCHFFY